MKVLTAKVIGGKLDMPEGALEEGVTVTVLVPEAESAFELSDEERSILLESLAQARRGEGMDGWQLLAELEG